MSTRSESRGRGPYRSGIRRREQIVATAVTVFAELGYAGGSIRAIADRVGISHATLLQHFGTKEGLLIAVLAEWDRRTVKARLAELTGLDYFRRLPEVMEGHLAHRGLLELFTTIAAEATTPAHPAHAFIRRRYADNLATLAAHVRHAVDHQEIRAMTDAEIAVEVRLITAVLDGIGLQWLLDPSTPVGPAVAAHVDRTIASWKAGR